jgi:predicted MFS family arabinose efflux permease
VDATSEGIDRRLVLVMAVAAGMAAANLYYAQPLLPIIAHTFHAGSGATGLIVTVSQLGYAAGIAFLLPLGDLINRRGLVPLVVSVTAVALMAAAVSPSLGFLIAVSAFVGAGSVVTHVMIPFGAELSTDEERGRVVGTIMTGLLCGILLARTTAGVIADLAGWRTVYMVAAGLMAVLAVGLRSELPSEQPRVHLPYRDLLRSATRLFATEPVLRLRCLYGFLSFACFSVLWTSVAFLLKGAPYHYSNTVIGLFGLVGAAGAVAANGAGRLADRGHTYAATLGFSAAMAVAFAVLVAGRSSLPALIVGILVLDAGSNGLHVLNQHTNYSLPTAPDARSRINAVYMTSFFLGGAAGSAASTAVYSHAGWTGVCVLGAGSGAVATLVALWRRG